MKKENTSFYLGQQTVYKYNLTFVLNKSLGKVTTKIANCAFEVAKGS